MIVGADVLADGTRVVPLERGPVKLGRRCGGYRPPELLRRSPHLVLGVGAAGPLWWGLAAQGLVQGGVAGDAEEGLYLSAGVAGPA